MPSSLGLQDREAARARALLRAGAQVSSPRPGPPPGPRTRPRGAAFSRKTGKSPLCARMARTFHPLSLVPRPPRALLLFIPPIHGPIDPSSPGVKATVTRLAFGAYAPAPERARPSAIGGDLPGALVRAPRAHLSHPPSGRPGRPAQRRRAGRAGAGTISGRRRRRRDTRGSGRLPALLCRGAGGGRTAQVAPHTVGPPFFCPLLFPTPPRPLGSRGRRPYLGVPCLRKKKKTSEAAP